LIGSARRRVELTAIAEDEGAIQRCRLGILEGQGRAQIHRDLGLPRRGSRRRVRRIDRAREDRRA
jgi:hypothetical protein